MKMVAGRSLLRHPSLRSRRFLSLGTACGGFTAAATALILSGCNGTLPAVPTEVLVPVATPCIAQADIPQATFATDAELAKLEDGPFVLALARDRLERQAHIASLEAILQGCAK